MYHFVNLRCIRVREQTFFENGRGFVLIKVIAEGRQAYSSLCEASCSKFQLFPEVRLKIRSVDLACVKLTGQYALPPQN